MSGTVHGKAERAFVPVVDLHPIHMLEVHSIVAAEANGDPCFLETETQQIVDVAFCLFLKITDRRSGHFIYATAIEGPAVVSVIQRYDDAAMSPVETVDAYQERKNRIAALADIFDAVFVREAPVIVEIDVTG